jgi:hypothetical protein
LSRNRRRIRGAGFFPADRDRRCCCSICRCWSDLAAEESDADHCTARLSQSINVADENMSAVPDDAMTQLADRRKRLILRCRKRRFPFARSCPMMAAAFTG